VDVHPSALKHGIAESDIRTAVLSPAYVADLDNDSPARQFRLGFDQAGRVLELVVLTFDSGNQLVIHAMKARSEYLELLD
jgi:hypothetical protein